MLFNRCPSPEALSEFAANAASASIAKHILTCQKCRDLVADFRRNEQLAREIRGVFEGGTDEVDARTRARLMRVCNDVARDVQTPGQPPAAT